MKIPLNLELGNRTYFSMCKQEDVGVQFDVEKAKALLVRANQWMDELEQQIEPTLPKKALNKGEQRELTPPKRQVNIDCTPSAFVTKWFDTVEQTDDSIICTKHVYGQDVTVKLPHHEPILKKIPMKLKDQGDIKEWLMRGNPNDEAKDLYTNIVWRDN